MSGGKFVSCVVSLVKLWSRMVVTTFLELEKTTEDWFNANFAWFALVLDFRGPM